MTLSFPFRLGCAYSFKYPRYNYRSLPTRLELRRVIVELLRDTQAEPLETSTLTDNPTLRRGRWLVMGYDLDREAQRSFYLDSMTEIALLSDDERAPFRHAEYVVLTSIGRAMYQSARLGDAMDFLVEQPPGILCKVLGTVE
ncbi:MAG: hypothetical protein JSS49_30200 [Planctomycetes bacterium]|nr:hypothetical protein [Planctomycetota bacterium]